MEARFVLEGGRVAYEMRGERERKEGSSSAYSSWSWERMTAGGRCGWCQTLNERRRGVSQGRRGLKIGLAIVT